MKKNPKAESGFFNPRLFFGFLLGLSGLSLAVFSFAANPASGSISTTGPIAPFSGTWMGTAPGVPPTGGGEDSCTEGTNCDSFQLTITGTPADWAAASKQVHVQITWTTPASDYDLFIHKGDLSGPGGCGIGIRRDDD